MCHDNGTGRRCCKAGATRYFAKGAGRACATAAAGRAAVGCCTYARARGRRRFIISGGGFADGNAAIVRQRSVTARRVGDRSGRDYHRRRGAVAAVGRQSTRADAATAVRAAAGAATGSATAWSVATPGSATSTASPRANAAAGPDCAADVAAARPGNAADATGDPVRAPSRSRAASDHRPDHAARRWAASPAQRVLPHGSARDRRTDSLFGHYSNRGDRRAGRVLQRIGLMGARAASGRWGG